jgi:hypothetical protein
MIAPTLFLTARLKMDENRQNSRALFWSANERNFDLPLRLVINIAGIIHHPLFFWNEQKEPEGSLFINVLI